MTKAILLLLLLLLFSFLATSNLLYPTPLSNSLCVCVCVCVSLQMCVGKQDHKNLTTRVIDAYARVCVCVSLPSMYDYLPWCLNVGKTSDSKILTTRVL